jgi:hypothetical protein
VDSRSSATFPTPTPPWRRFAGCAADAVVIGLDSTAAVNRRGAKNTDTGVRFAGRIDAHVV